MTVELPPIVPKDVGEADILPTRYGVEVTAPDGAVIAFALAPVGPLLLPHQLFIADTVAGLELKSERDVEPSMKTFLVRTAPLTLGEAVSPSLPRNMAPESQESKTFSVRVTPETVKPVLATTFSW